MSQSPMGPGWWQASDGNWYPPEAHPSAAAGGATTAFAGDPFTEKPFFARLFDWSMTHFITPSIIKILFILAVVIVSLWALFIEIVSIRGLSDGADGAIIGVLFAPVFWLFGVVYARVLLETILVFFRIERNTRGQRS